jgi:hypothetical protein
LGDDFGTMAITLRCGRVGAAVVYCAEDAPRRGWKVEGADGGVPRADVEEVFGELHATDGGEQVRTRTRDADCRCFGSDRTPGVAPQGAFRSRAVSTTVAKWFVPIARGTMDKVCRFGPLRSA